MPPDYTIRLAKAGDADRIRQIAEESYSIYLPRMGRKPFPMLDDYEAHIDHGSVFVLESDGEILGYLVLLQEESNSLLLDNIAIAPNCQKQGFGRALMAFAETEALKRGLCAVSLYTNAAMTENLAWYPSLGYQETGRKMEKGYQRVYFRKLIQP